MTTLEELDILIEEATNRLASCKEPTSFRAAKERENMIRLICERREEEGNGSSTE